MVATSEAPPDNERVAFCANCGQSLPEEARFCPSCAAAVVVPSSGPPPEERKVATVLFADLVGSTALAGSQDPERTRAVLNRFYDAMAAEIAEVGGTVEKFVGDAVMAAFGAPAAQEDHAERALHAALSMQRRLAELFGDSLALRIGINTGDVVVGVARAGSSFVSGDAVNVAARLEQAAEPGQILVGDRTAAAARGAFEFGEVKTVAAKGKAGGLTCHELVRALSLMKPRGIGGLARAFVGREIELGMLKTTYERAVGDSKPYLVTIMGDAGVGKTTLIRQFWEWLGSEAPAPVRRVGRCASYGQGVTYLPIGEIVREHLGLLESESPERVRERLGKYGTLGMTIGLDAPATLHPLAARDRLRQAWVDFVRELVADQPAVILLEDLHWAEDALLELVEAALEDVDGQLLLLGTGRPELIRTRPGWNGRMANAAVIWLEPLSVSNTVDLLDRLIPAALPPRTRELVIERAEGNPFFVEELVRALIDQGVLVQSNGTWSAGELPRDLALPDTVQAVLAARIDLLEPAEKAALQAAAVIGRTFWSGPVYELVEGQRPDLRVLEERDFVRHRTSSALVGEREFVIKHALTREVAYASVPKARRALLHARFADWLDRIGEGRQEFAAALAHHYAEAVRPDDSDLVWAGNDDELARLRLKAVASLRRAAGLAVARYEMDDALKLLRQAVELEPDPSEQLVLWREIGRAAALYFDGTSFSAAMERAIELSDNATILADLYAELAFQTLVRAGMWGTAPPAELVEGWIVRALELAEAESASRAQALIARSYSEYEKSVGPATEATEISERLGDPVLRSYSYDVQALTAFVAGDYDLSLDWHRRRLALVPNIQDPDHHADVYGNAIAPAIARGHFDEARRYSELLEDVTHELSPHHRLHGIAAGVELEEHLGNWEAVVELQPRVEAAVADNTNTPCVRNQRSLLVCAVAQQIKGNEAEARRLEQEAEAHSMTGYGTVLDTPRIRLALAREQHGALEGLIGQPQVRRTNWFFLSSMAAHLDALAALGQGHRIEREAALVAAEGTYLEAFALRALGQVRGDAKLGERAADRFDELGLAWHAAQTRALL